MKKGETRIERDSQAFREGLRLQEIEGSPLRDEQVAMFDMFHREGWSNERCLEYIRDRIEHRRSHSHAAE